MKSPSRAAKTFRRRFATLSAARSNASRARAIPACFATSRLRSPAIGTLGRRRTGAPGRPRAKTARRASRPACTSTEREDSDVVGNVLYQGYTTRSHYPIRVGGDGTAQTFGRFRFVNNTISTHLTMRATTRFAAANDGARAPYFSMAARCHRERSLKMGTWAARFSASPTAPR